MTYPVTGPCLRICLQGSPKTAQTCLLDVSPWAWLPLWLPQEKGAFEGPWGRLFSCRLDLGSAFDCHFRGQFCTTVLRQTPGPLATPGTHLRAWETQHGVLRYLDLDTASGGLQKGKKTKVSNLLVGACERGRTRATPRCPPGARSCTWCSLTVAPFSPRAPGPLLRVDTGLSGPRGLQEADLPLPTSALLVFPQVLGVGELRESDLHPDQGGPARRTVLGETGSRQWRPGEGEASVTRGGRACVRVSGRVGSGVLTTEHSLNQLVPQDP